MRERPRCKNCGQADYDHVAIAGSAPLCGLTFEPEPEPEPSCFYCQDAHSGDGSTWHERQPLNEFDAKERRRARFKNNTTPCSLDAKYFHRLR